MRLAEENIRLEQITFLILMETKTKSPFKRMSTILETYIPLATLLSGKKMLLEHLEDLTQKPIPGERELSPDLWSLIQ